MGSCFSEGFGGSCSGIPKRCDKCLDVCKGKSGEQFSLPASNNWYHILWIWFVLKFWLRLKTEIGLFLIFFDKCILVWVDSIWLENKTLPRTVCFIKSKVKWVSCKKTIAMYVFYGLKKCDRISLPSGYQRIIYYQNIPWVSVTCKHKGNCWGNICLLSTFLMKYKCIFCIWIM